MILSAGWNQGKGISASLEEPVVVSAEEKIWLFINPHQCFSNKQLQLQIPCEKLSKKPTLSYLRSQILQQTQLKVWICDSESQTQLWMCILGWEETSISFFFFFPFH